MLLLQDATFFPIFMQKWENKTKGRRKTAKLFFESYLYSRKFALLYHLVI